MSVRGIPPGASQKHSATCLRHQRGLSKSFLERAGGTKAGAPPPLALRRARGTGGPEARALHDDLVGAVSEAVQRAVGEDGIVEEGHPFVHRRAQGVIGPGLMQRLRELGDGDAADAVAGASGTVPFPTPTGRRR